MKKLFKNKKTIFLLGAWLFEFVLNIWFTAKYVLVDLMNSDWSGDAIFARHLSDTGHYIFSTDWIPTTELYIVHHQLIMVPLFKLFNDYRTVWIITSIIAFLLITLCLYYFMKCMNQEFNETFLAIVLFLNPIVEQNLTYTVWFHGYLFYYLMAFMLVGILGKYYISKNRIKLTDLIILLAISFLSGICGLRMFIMVFAPLIISYVLLNLKSPISKLWDEYSKVVCASTFAALVGFAIYMFVLAPGYGAGFIVNSMKKNTLTINDSGTVLDTFLRLPQLFAIVMGIDFQNNSIGSFVAYRAVLLCFWVAILIVLVRGIKKEWQDVRIKYLTTLFGSSIVVTCVLIMFVVKPDEIVDDARYLSLAAFLLFPIYAMVTRDAYREVLRDYLDIGGYILAGVGILAFILNTFATYGTGEQISWRMPYIAYLEENGYHFGLATYWNANDTIFFSENKIEMQPVEDVISMEYAATNTKKSNSDRTPEFLLMLREEYESRLANGFSDVVLYEDDRVVITDIQ